MRDWWQTFSTEWSWTDPGLVVSVVTILVTALIPIFLWRLGTKQAKRDGVLNELQARTLTRQEQIIRRQRRDSLLEIVDRSSDATHLSLLRHEILEYEGGDRELLLAAFRSNVALALPGSHHGVQFSENLSDDVVAHYVNALERRYSECNNRFHTYPGLIDFVSAASAGGAKIEVPKIVALVIGSTAEHQRPGHIFYRDLVNVLPESAAELLSNVENIDYRDSGGLRLNILTGTLLAIKDAELGRAQHRSVPPQKAVVELRRTVPVALAGLLHRDNLRSFDRWSKEGSTEPITATVAWLIRAIGWLSDVDDHLAWRMTQNLAAAIESVPNQERGWGIDDEDVQVGFEGIKKKQPALWDAYGAALESAATSVGPW